VLQTSTSGRIPFQIHRGFGTSADAPLYLNHPYSFGIYGGLTSLNLSNAIRIQVYYRSNSALAGTIALPIPDPADTNQLGQFLTNGFTKTVEQLGLRTTLQDSPVCGGATNWAANTWSRTRLRPRPPLLLRTRSQRFWAIQRSGLQSIGPDWSRMYVLQFSPFPAGRSLFVDQPHFDTLPLPPSYQGKTVQELTNVTATLPDLSSLAGTNYLTVNSSRN